MPRRDDVVGPSRAGGMARFAAVAVVLAVTVTFLVGALAVAQRLGPRGDVVVDGRRVGAAEVSLDPDNPLRGQLRLTGLDRAASVEVDVRAPGGRGWRLAADVTGDELRLPLLALRPDTRYRIDTVLRDAAGAQVGRTRQPLGLGTRRLPDWFDAVQASGRAPVPGLTLFDAAVSFPDDADDAPPFAGLLVAVDEAGEVVWYEPEQRPPQDIVVTDDGNLIYVYDEMALRERTPTGELVAEWAGRSMRQHRAGELSEDVSIPVDTDQMHHEVDVLPDGNLLTLSREVVLADGFTREVCDRFNGGEGSYRIGSDTVVEIDRDSGEVVAEWPLLDHLDPAAYEDRLIDHEFCGNYLDVRYPDRAPVRDWSHGNAIAVDEARNLLWVSPRHLDQLLALRFRDDATGPAGELVWKLGEGGDFALAGGEWFLHQHAPEVLDDGSILLYDNGNQRPGTSLDDPDRLPYSRAVVYALDEATMTATQVWEHRLAPEPDGDPVYAPYVGDADRIDDTVLITHGGLLDPTTHNPVAPDLLRYTRIVEVDYATGEILLDIAIRDPRGEVGWRVYRADRVDHLYPAGIEATRLLPED